MYDDARELNDFANVPENSYPEIGNVPKSDSLLALPCIFIKSSKTLDPIPRISDAS